MIDDVYKLLYNWFLLESDDKDEYHEYEIANMLHNSKILINGNSILVLYDNDKFDVFKIVGDCKLEHLNPWEELIYKLK